MTGPRHNRPPMDIVNPHRICPECSTPFKAHHGRQAYCTPEHKAAFHDRNKVRGKIMVPLVQTWRGARNVRGGSIGRYAFAEMCALADLWNAEDKAAGRQPALTITRKEREGWAAVDVVHGKSEAQKAALGRIVLAEV